MDGELFNIPFVNLNKQINKKFRTCLSTLESFYFVTYYNAASLTAAA